MKNRLGRAAIVLVTIALAPTLSTCGSSSGSCGKVPPCGGDVVGTWTVSSTCVNNASIAMQIAAGLLPNCPDLTANVSSIHLTGSESFNADMTFSVNEELTASGQAMIPASCLQLNGVTLTCAQFDLFLQSYVAANPGMLQSVHCAANSTECICGFALAPQNINQTGNYSISGTTVTVTGSPGTSSYDYCVKNNELHLIAVNASVSAGTTGLQNVDGDTVLTKN